MLRILARETEMPCGKVAGETGMGREKKEIN
jgi:hypothetical protein